MSTPSISELSVLKSLWRQQPLSAREIHEAVGAPDFADAVRHLQAPPAAAATARQGRAPGGRFCATCRLGWHRFDAQLNFIEKGITT